MALSEERAQVLTNFLIEDKERGEKLLKMKPEEALNCINEFGYDFTMNEIKEYGAALKVAATDGEIKETDLENVSGGILATATIITGCKIAAIAFGAGVCVGLYESW